MKHAIAALCLLAALGGCAGNAASQADRDACAAAGYAPETEAFEACLQERIAERFARPAGEEVDDLRLREGPQL